MSSPNNIYEQSLHHISKDSMNNNEATFHFHLRCDQLQVRNDRFRDNTTLKKLNEHRMVISAEIGLGEKNQNGSCAKRMKSKVRARRAR